MTGTKSSDNIAMLALMSAAPGLSIWKWMRKDRMMTKKQQTSILRQLEVLDKELAAFDAGVAGTGLAYTTEVAAIGAAIDALRRRVRRYI